MINNLGKNLVEVTNLQLETQLLFLYYKKQSVIPTELHKKITIQLRLLLLITIQLEQLLPQLWPKVQHLI